MGFAVAYTLKFGMLLPLYRGIEMKSFLTRLVTPLLATSVLSLSFSAHADYNTLFMDLAAGEDMSHYRLGIGDTQKGVEGDKVTSMIYLGYFQSDDMTTLENTNLGKQEFEILTLGAGGFGYLANPDEHGGAEFDFEISKTSSDLYDYDRTGVGMRAQLFLPVVSGLQANLGVNLRPYFLSGDWDDTAKLEYEYQAGLEFAFNWDIALYAHYRFVGAYLKNDDKLSMAEGTMFGLRARF
jgi:opacity protein-like surface antigen